MSGLIQQKIETKDDEHVFIHVVHEREDIPDLSIDINSLHGRRRLSIRVDGMTTATLLVDVEELPGHSNVIQRFCPYCGEERNIIASVDRHVCGPDAS